MSCFILECVNIPTTEDVRYFSRWLKTHSKRLRIINCNVVIFFTLIKLFNPFNIPGIRREISLNNGDKCALHYLQVKTRFTNVSDGLWVIYCVHKYIVQSTNKYQTIWTRKIIFTTLTHQKTDLPDTGVVILQSTETPWLHTGDLHFTNYDNFLNQLATALVDTNAN